MTSTDLGALGERVFAAVIFDMDGTLIDSTPAVERSWATWLEHYGISGYEVPHGVPAKVAAKDLFPPDQVDAAVAHIEQIEIDDTGDIVTLPGAVDALEAITDDRRAIATSCTRPLFEARIKAAGFPRPATVVTASDVVNGKPDPEPFLKAAALLGQDPAECLVFEDAPGGITAARAAGCPVIGVATTYGAEQLDAEVVISTLADVELVQGEAGISVRLR